MSNLERENRIRALNMAISEINQRRSPIGYWPSAQVLARIRDELIAGRTDSSEQ